jgi:hypothetical protein
MAFIESDLFHDKRRRLMREKPLLMICFNEIVIEISERELFHYKIRNRSFTKSY